MRGSVYGIDTGLPPDPAPGTAAGWRPSTSNPNEELYWDGSGWTARRRWTAAGYLDLPVGPPLPTTRGDQGPGRRPASRRTAVVATAIGVVVAVVAVVLVVANRSAHKDAAPSPGTRQGGTGPF